MSKFGVFTFVLGIILTVLVMVILELLGVFSCLT